MSQYIVDGSATLSKRRAAFPDGAWHLAGSGQGAYVFSDEGVPYMDLVSALGALTVGHAHPHVVRAVQRQIERGSLYSWPSKLEGAVAERLQGHIPSAQLFKFAKSGSEACAAAIMTARAARAGQSALGTILTFEGHYHGWLSDTTVRTPVHPGRPEWMQLGMSQLPSEATADIVREHLAGVAPHAAMICEPERLPHLKEVVEVCREHGMLIIFDETLSGGRLAVAGMQALVDIVPDLSVYGKAFGGGLPMAFICGTEAVMRHAWTVSGTFSGDALGLAACNAMLDLYEVSDIIRKLDERGAVLKHAFLRVSQRHPHLGMVIHGRNPRFWVSFAPDQDRRALMSAYVLGMHDLGYLTHPAVTFASAALTSDDVERAAQDIEGVWDDVVSGRLAVAEQHRYADSVR